MEQPDSSLHLVPATSAMRLVLRYGTEHGSLPSLEAIQNVIAQQQHPTGHQQAKEKAKELK